MPPPLTLPSTVLANDFTRYKNKVVIICNSFSKTPDTSAPVIFSAASKTYSSFSSSGKQAPMIPFPLLLSQRYCLIFCPISYFYTYTSPFFFITKALDWMVFIQPIWHIVTCLTPISQTKPAVLNGSINVLKLIWVAEKCGDVWWEHFWAHWRPVMLLLSGSCVEV